MTIDQAATFLAGSVLTSIGFVVIVIAIVAVNNIIYRYWKSFGWNFFPAYIGKDEAHEESKK
jgi:hypothetical protein